MSLSTFKTTQYTAASFVESAGAVLIKRSTREICLIHSLAKDERLLPKGRRAAGESRLSAALRETAEETGYRCEALRVNLRTRAEPADGAGWYSDEPRLLEGVCEPFMVTCRHLEEGREVKFIWWFLVAVCEEEKVGEPEAQFEAQLFGLEEAVERLTFEFDRDVVREAIRDLEDSEGMDSAT